MFALFGVLALFATSVVLVEWVRAIALARNMVDRPEPRRTSLRETPRGGGAPVALLVIAGCSLAGLTHNLSPQTTSAMLVGGLIVTMIGWMEDRFGLPVLARFVAQIVAAAWAVFAIGGMPTLSMGTHLLRLGWWGSPLAVVGIVWATNLYNFMDGIDGLAGTQAVSVGAIGALLLAVSGAQHLWVVPALIAITTAGFLLHNWHPARIFLGDSGAYFLGFAFGVIALRSERLGAVPALAWVALLGFFVIDATITLVRRIIRRERIWLPHRQHAYQRLVSAGLPPSLVSHMLLAGNLVLAAIVAACLTMKIIPLPALLLFPLACYALVVRRFPLGGRSESQRSG